MFPSRRSHSSWRGWEGCIYIKAFTERFGFDDSRISQIQTVCQEQSNGECPKGVLYIIRIDSMPAKGVET